MSTAATQRKNLAATLTAALQNWRARSATDRSPNRPMIAAGALALGLFAGAAIGLLGELAATALAALALA
ncbi:MAG: hypothetical protein ABW049_00235, partial [Spongiibacteraceae bacterium]